MEISELRSDQLDALATLERRILTTDQVRLKLEWPSLRAGRTVAGLVAQERGELVGFIGLYAFGGAPDVELHGMVDPSQRRRGIATQLLDRALEICDAQGYSHRLLVVPRASAAAVRLVTRRGAELQHAEYSLALEGEPQRRAEDPATTLRDATERDRADRIRILTAGFGPPPDAAVDQLRGASFWNVMIEHAGVPVGQARLGLSDGRGDIAGFAIDPEYRGRGIGRDALGRLCELLREQGAERVELQVEAENDLALGLYLSTGFITVSAEDYYRLAPR